MQSLSASHCSKTNIPPLGALSLLHAKSLPWGRGRRGESALPRTRKEETQSASLVCEGVEVGVVGDGVTRVLR